MIIKYIKIIIKNISKNKTIKHFSKVYTPFSKFPVEIRLSLSRG